MQFGSDVSRQHRRGPVMRAVGSGGLLAPVSAASPSGPSPQPVPRGHLFAHRSPPPTRWRQNPELSRLSQDLPRNSAGPRPKQPGVPMCRTHPVLLFAGLRAESLAPLCRAQGSFLDVTPTYGMHCGHQGLLGSSRAGTPRTDASAGAVPVCPADTCCWATVRSLLILVSPESRARNARRPPRIWSTLPLACRGLSARSPSMRAASRARQTARPLRDARPCRADCAGPPHWGRGTPGKGAALWCLPVETDVRCPMKHVFLTNFSLTGLF